MLVVKDLELFYGASQALYGFNFEASVGKISCVLGRNGVGKTSFAKAIVGRHLSTSGNIMWKNVIINKFDSAERAHLGIAYVPQGREIFARLTVRENLEIGFAALNKEDHKIPDNIFDLFPVLKQMLNRRGGDLSGGQQQQLAIARALVMRPSLLILDEPTEGIQPSIIKDIGAVLMLLREKGDIAIVLIEQYLEFALSVSDRLYVLDRGRVKIEGDPQDINLDLVRQTVSL